jgi:hypothetical protein
MIMFMVGFTSAWLLLSIIHKIRTQKDNRHRIKNKPRGVEEYYDRVNR